MTVVILEGGSGIKFQAILGNTMRPRLQRQKHCSRNSGVLDSDTLEVSWRGQVEDGLWTSRAKLAVSLVYKGQSACCTVHGISAINSAGKVALYYKMTLFSSVLIAPSKSFTHRLLNN